MGKRKLLTSASTILLAGGLSSSPLASAVMSDISHVLVPRRANHFRAPGYPRDQIPGAVVRTMSPQSQGIALTFDDGRNSTVVQEALILARDTGLRFTIFVTGSYPAWKDNKHLLRPMVDSGQIQLANHTWSHPNLLHVTDAVVADEIEKTDNFLKKFFGAEARPYFRPPYGATSTRIESIAADLGYSSTVLWDEVIHDWDVLHDRAGIVADAQGAFQAGKIILAHLNQPSTIDCLDDFVALMGERKLSSFTLDDFFVRPDPLLSPV